MKREDIFYEAFESRDHRFDGKFFVGVKTTGIYCRPICPAKPKRQNVEFFSTALAAERGGLPTLPEVPARISSPLGGLDRQIGRGSPGGAVHRAGQSS